MTIWVYDKTFTKKAIVDGYSSIIWTNRYKENGDCEIYLPINKSSLNTYKIGYFLVRTDDNMICRINKIEIQTSAEDGDYLVVTGVDLKSILDQRIIWGTQYTSSSVNTMEKFIRQIIYKSLGQGADEDRKISIGGKYIQLGTQRNFPEKSVGQVSYANVGEYIREYCEQYGRGYRLVYYQNNFYVNLFQGTDRTDSVIFSTFLDTLNASDYTDDESDLANVVLVGGEGEGKNRILRQGGSAKGINRYEIFVDDDGNSKTISFEELVDQYPREDVAPYTGYGRPDRDQDTGKWYYLMRVLDVQIFDLAQYQWLQRNYGYLGITYEDDSGNAFYQITKQAPNGEPQKDIYIASLPEYVSNEEPGDAVLKNIIYYQYLLNDGFTELGEHGSEKTFECTVIPNSSYTYKTDYNLGDKVKVDNGYGVELDADIIEVIESEDENGYNIELTLQAYFPEKAGFIPPNPPQDVTASARPAYNTITWTSLSAENFEVWRCEGTDDTRYIEKILDADINDFDGEVYRVYDTHIGSPYTYYYRVIAIENGAKSMYSQEASCTGNPYPSIPQNLAAEALSNYKIKLTWRSVRGATSYNIYRRSGNTYEFLNDTVDTEYTDSGLSQDTYYYKVSAVNGGVYEGELSSPVHQTAHS